MTTPTINRRLALKQGACVLFSIAAIPIVALPRTARAGGAAKADFHYQDYPNAGKSCSSCSAFLPSTQNAAAEGSCKIVAGPVYPSGWCMAYSKKT
jgi:hypothetical protein